MLAVSWSSSEYFTRGVTPHHPSEVFGGTFGYNQHSNKPINQHWKRLWEVP